MDKSSKIFIAGATGLVGSALVRCLNRSGYVNLLTPTRSQVDLTKQYEVSSLFKRERPECVVIAAVAFTPTTLIPRNLS